MKLPFNKAEPFPAAAFTPTPTRLKMGVEAQSSAARAPMSASDRMAALGRSAAPAPAPLPSAPAPAPQRPAPAGMMPMMAAPLPRPVNPLGGMDSRSISARGGPMSYSQQGVGTTNPNAYAVGKNRAPVGMRMLTQAARRRDPRAIMALATMEQDQAQQGQQMSLMQMREAADAQRFDQQQQNAMTMFEREQQAAQQRDATNFEQQQQMFQMQSQQRAGESALEFQRRQEAEAAQRAAEGDPTKVTTAQIPGTDYVIPFAGNKAMGTLPVMKAETPLPAGLVPTGAMRGGVQYGPVKTAQERPRPLEMIEPRESSVAGQTATPRLQRDPVTGEMWKLDESNQWVPFAPPISRGGAAPAKATPAPAAEAAADPKARINALRKRMGLTEL